MRGRQRLNQGITVFPKVTPGVIVVNPVALTWCHNGSIVDDLEVVPHALLGVAIWGG